MNLTYKYKLFTVTFFALSPTELVHNLRCRQKLYGINIREEMTDNFRNSCNDLQVATELMPPFYVHKSSKYSLIKPKNRSVGRFFHLISNQQRVILYAKHLAMNSLDSMIEPVQNISTFADVDNNCTAFDKTTGELCGETESLKIIDEFQKLYETRIENVDRELENEFDQVCMKLEISREWIRNLREQNVMLVKTVEDLERAAGERVKLLEQKLKQSSTILSENMINSDHTEETIRTLSNRVGNLEKDETCMRQKLQFLQSDIRGLIELIRRATQENHWNLDGIKFFEIQPSDIPIPDDCTCRQEETDYKRMRSLELQIEQFEENEKTMVAYQRELEDKLANLNEKLETKEETIKQYIGQLQNFSNNLKKRAKFADRIASDQQTFDIVLMADIVENMLIEKDLETRCLQQRLRVAESNNLATVARDTNRNLNNLKVQLNEKCKAIREVQQQMVNLNKESLEKQDALTAELINKREIVVALRNQIAVLREQCRCANMQIDFKEDIIKEMRKELKRAIAKETHATANVDANACRETPIISYLTKVKSLMEQEKDDLYKLKVELERTVDKLCCEKDLEYVLVKNVNCIKQMYSKKGESIEIVRSIILKMENNNSLRIDGANLFPSTDANQQFELMDIFRACAIEAQATTEDIKDEMGIIASTFESRHEKYADLNKEVVNVQNRLTQNREKLAEAINRLRLQEEERLRHNERIDSRKINLKDIKNRLNHAQSRLSLRINDMENNLKEDIVSNYTELCICDDLLRSAVQEVEQTSSTLQLFHTQQCHVENAQRLVIRELFKGCCIASDLEDLDTRLCDVDSSVKLLQRKIEEALLEHDTVETILRQKEQRLEKLEKDVDAIHSKIRDIAETSVSSKDQISESNIAELHPCTQILNEIPRIKQDLHKLRKQQEELKHRISQKPEYTECDEKTCLWKRKVTDLQDQVKILQHEAKCNQEANQFLRNSMMCVEEELYATQAKAENYRRSSSMDNIELKKKIIEFENTLKLQEEIECTLRQRLNDNEVELKKSKELLNSSHIDHTIEETLLRCNQFRHDTMTVDQLFKTLQNTMASTKTGLRELKEELKKLICENPSNVCPSVKSLMSLLDKLQQYEDELDGCSPKIEKLQNALYSKDKLLENKDEIIKIQKDSIVMVQAELKELHQKSQEKIDNQDRVISGYENEKKELLRQNELQIQTIGHLQNAVVEAKKCMDQMGHRAMSDLQEKSKTIRLLSVRVEETQSQYNECFAEAAKQDKMLELQRDVLRDLQQKICRMERDNGSTVSFIHATHYSILKTIQEQLEIRVSDIQALKCKMDTLVQARSYLEDRYLNMKKLWQEAETKLQGLKKAELKSEQTIYENKGRQCTARAEDKNCTIDFNDATCNDMEQFKNSSHEHELQSEIDFLSRENEDMKRQLQKCKLDFDIIDKELKIERENGIDVQRVSFELEKLKDTEAYLRYENDQLKSDLKKQTQTTEALLEKLKFVKENGMKFEKLYAKLKDKQTQINGLCNQIANNETIIKTQAETIEELEKKVDTSNKQIKGYLSELNVAEEEMSILHDRIQSLKTLLSEKSDNMAKLQADYEVLKNDNSILRMENNAFEGKTKEDVCELKNVLKNVEMQLCFAEENYRKVTEDFHKTQGQLIDTTKREADLQEYFTNMEKDYCSKLSNAEKEKAKLRDCLDKLRDELEEIQRDYVSQNGELCKLRDICKSYGEKSNILQQQIEKEREKVAKLEESNNCMVRQLDQCMEQNCVLIEEKAMAEQNNCKILFELQETHKSLLGLRKECRLKNESLACISAELTETAISRSELCNQSQYVVSCIRIWMDEQREYVNKLGAKLKSHQQQLLQLGFERKAFLDETKRLRRINHLLGQRLKRMHRCGGKSVKSICVGCQMVPTITAQNAEILIPIGSKHPFLQKKSNVTKTARRVSACGNTWWFPKMKYLINELRKNNLKYDKNFYNREGCDRALEENRDCGYQSSTSK